MNTGGIWMDSAEERRPARGNPSERISVSPLRAQCQIWGTCYLDDYRVFAILRGVGFVFATLGNGFIVFLILRSKAIRKERFNLLIILLASAAV
ncbi:hypothetical protein QR680_019019 [Steinernema hermaphroditum]|uniref:Uncharacterized protein n=1 Tax=Steinernema hermaphroditum TaxID=289476 RepID=A0AA39LRM5_9BILA|nr:hypothetical protein QR680_019019 [Steinernema hermaphroditum]